MQVPSNWWQELFDEIYLMTDARSVCNEALTFKEVDFLENALKLSVDIDDHVSILDLCGGQGRHALELSRRGYKCTTVLDYSTCLIDLGRRTAGEKALNTTFIQGDARGTCLNGESFDYIIIMGSSFGYFVNQDENLKILKEAFRLLKRGGMLLLDLPDLAYVTGNFHPVSLHQVNSELEVKRRRELKEDIIYCRETVVSNTKGCLRDNTYCTRLYSPEKISEMLYEVRFDSVRFYKDFMRRDHEGDFGTMTNRMVVMAEK